MAEEITLNDTKHVADLANLHLSQEELEKLTEMFADTLEYVDLLNELDTAAISETFQVTGLKNVFQVSPINSQELTQEQALQNAAEVEKAKFVTEAVFDR